MKKFGHDINSIVANPNFKDPLNFDFRLKNKKNSNSINFNPFNFNLAGVYGDKNWIKKSKLSTEITTKFDEVVLRNMKKQTNRD